MINISCQMNHQWVGNSEKLETSKISPPAGIGYQRDNFVFTKKMGYNVQAAIKFWHIYYKCVRELSVTLILLVSLFIFVILPAIPLVLLHFIKWYLIIYVLKGLWSIKYFCLHTIGLNACDRSSQFPASFTIRKLFVFWNR